MIKDHVYPGVSLNNLDSTKANVLDLLVVKSAAGPSYAYAATDLGVFRATSDTGFSDDEVTGDFTLFTDGMDPVHMNTRELIRYEDIEGMHVMVSVDRNYDSDTGGAIYQQPVGGDRWSQQNISGVNDAYRRMWGLARHPADPSQVYACDAQYEGVLYELAGDPGSYHFQRYFDASYLDNVAMPYSADPAAAFGCRYLDVAATALLAGGRNRGGMWLIDRNDPTKFINLTSRPLDNGRFVSRGASDFTAVFDVAFGRRGRLIAGVGDWSSLYKNPLRRDWITELNRGKTRSLEIDANGWLYKTNGQNNETIAYVELSTDNAESWEKIASSEPGQSTPTLTEVRHLAISHGRLYVVAKTSAGWRLLRKDITTKVSATDAHNWQDLTGNGLPTADLRMVVASANGSDNLIWVATSVGLFASSDTGDLFQQYQAGSTTVGGDIEMVANGGTFDEVNYLEKNGTNRSLFRTRWHADPASRLVPELLTEDYKFVKYIYQSGRVVYFSDRKAGLLKVDLDVQPYQVDVYDNPNDPLPNKDIFFVTKHPRTDRLMIGTHCYGLWEVGGEF